MSDPVEQRAVADSRRWHGLSVSKPLLEPEEAVQHHVRRDDGRRVALVREDLGEGVLLRRQEARPWRRAGLGRAEPMGSVVGGVQAGEQRRV